MRRIEVAEELLAEAPARPWWMRVGGLYSGAPIGLREGKSPILSIPYEVWPSAGVTNFIVNGPELLEWAVARIRRLEAALNVARLRHGGAMELEGSWCKAAPESIGPYDPPRVLGPCDCGADAHNAAIEAALNEDES